MEGERSRRRHRFKALIVFVATLFGVGVVLRAIHRNHSTKAQEMTTTPTEAAAPTESASVGRGRLHGKRVLITGTDGGLGQAAQVREGARVVGCGQGSSSRR